MIFNRFKTLSSLSNTEAEKWSYVIEDCMVEINNMLLPDCDVEENSHRLTAVTAALALYRYRCILAAKDEQPSSFKAGDVAIELDGGAVKSAYRLYSEQLAAISDILKINDFVFGRTDSLCTEN